MRELSKTQKNKEVAAVSSRPLTPKYTERLVGRTEPGVKGERKGLFCAFRPSGSQRHTYSHPYSHIKSHVHMLTHAHAYTPTCVGSKVAPTSRFVLGQPENSAQTSACFTMMRSCRGNTGCCIKLATRLFL